MRQLKNIRL